MGIRTLQQPDGNWCLFSTVSDTVVLIDATREEVTEFFAERARQQTIYSSEQAFKMFDEGARFQLIDDLDEYRDVLARHMECKANCDDDEFNTVIEERLAQVKECLSEEEESL